ncbi:MAG: TonB family protein [Deltaproteobacteria bacterium]|nr:MAG: TonB family protein [Deltaproteobacteria bacterium]
MAKDEKLKLLRVGVIQDRRVVEERLLRKHEDVTIGSAAKNTFIVPNAGLPKSAMLFEAKGTSQYALSFETGMDGRVDLGDEPLTLGELAKSSRAQRRGNRFVVPLTSRARGKIVIGNVTLLFQFVDAPPVVPRPQLPAAAKGGITSQLEWPLVYILIASFLVLGGSGTALDLWWRMTGQYMQRDYTDHERIYELLNVETRAEVIKKEEPKEDEKKDTEKTDTTETEETKTEEPPQPEPPKVARTPKRDKKPMTADERKAARAKLTSKVRNKTFLHALGSSGGDDSGPLDTLKNGIHAERLENAFNDTTSGVTAATEDGGGFVGGPSEATKDGSRYKSLSSKDTGGNRIATQTVKTDTKDAGSEIKVRANVRDGSVSGQTGTGQIDKASVARVFSRRKGAIKYCYEKSLKVNPNLRGKVTIRFTIGPAGRITDIDVSENSTGDTAIAQCIVGKVKGWKFEPPSGGSVTFSYPFLLDTK